MTKIFGNDAQIAYFIHNKESIAQHGIDMNTQQRLLGTLFLFFSVTTFAHGKVIYTWVDEAGVSHYSEQAPVGVDAKRIYSEDIEPGKVGFVSPKEKVSGQPAKTQLEKDAEIIKSLDAEQAKMLCERAQHSLTILTTYNKLNKKNEKTGETVSMTEDERQQEIAMNKERVALFCD